MTNVWQKPAFTELSMNAEIGSYQEDFGSRGNPPIVDQVAVAEPEAGEDEGG